MIRKRFHGIEIKKNPQVLMGETEYLTKMVEIFKNSSVVN